MPVPVALRAALLLLFTVIIVTIAPLAARAQTANDIGPPPPPRFVPSDVVEEARRDAEKRQARTAEETKAADELGQLGSSALAAGDSRSAADYFRRAVALAKDDPAPWIGLARAKLAIAPADGNETYALPREATSAALAAYGLTRTAALRAESLAVLAQALERRELFRPALEAYKASLGLAESAPVRQAFLELKSRKGFRVVDHSVDADTLVPRICVQISDDLVKSGTDYSSYVTLDGKPGAGCREGRPPALRRRPGPWPALPAGAAAGVAGGDRGDARSAGHARGLCPRSRRGCAFHGKQFRAATSGRRGSRWSPSMRGRWSSPCTGSAIAGLPG